jgi:hypothetical protein
MLWRRMTVGSQNRLLWSGLAIGWVFWTIAEFWWGIAAIMGQEVPYPSWADFFWLAGYIPMFIALQARLRSLPQNINLLQEVVIWSAILLTMAVTLVFVLLPILRNNDPTAILESTLNILYPVVDVALLVLVLRMLFSYQQGIYGSAWVWLTAGFALQSPSNLLFSYATTADLYYPDQKVNLLSTLGVDIPYNLGYLLWLIGILIARTVHVGHRSFKGADFAATLVPNTHILVFTKGDDTVIDVSRNYSRVFPLETATGKTIVEALGISPGATDGFLRDIKEDKVLKERAMYVTTRLGQQLAQVSGITVNNPQGSYSGVSLLLRLFTANYTLDELLSGNQKGILSSISGKTGAKENEENEIKQLLSNYYRAYIKAFYDRLFLEGGGIMTDAFLAELQSAAKQHGWKVNLHTDALLDVSALSLPKIREVLPVLFETAKQFVEKTIDEKSADSIVEDVRSHFDETTLGNIAYFEKAKEERILNPRLLEK